MKLCNSRHRRDTITTKLRKLLALRSENVNETIHVANTKTLDAIGGVSLPLWPETVPIVSLTIVGKYEEGERTW
jgi:hypothetical protein